MIKIAPSLLAADFARLKDEVALVENAGADYLHLDIMDGHFVPNISFGPQVVAALRPLTKLPFDVHLMLSQPDHFLQAFAEAGADIITVHAEASLHLHRTLDAIRQLGVRVGVALNPATPLNAVENVLDMVEQVLFMTVNPGFGGQRFIPRVCAKMKKLQVIDEAAELDIEVDGGINPLTAAAVCRAGAKVLVAGTAVFTAPDPAAAMAELRAAVTGR